MTPESAALFMARALQLAAQGRYSTFPNPRVGCLVVRDGEVVGQGFHQRAGEPHAEVYALREAGERARGADVFVTLEPCSHHGRTPPCADALIAAGVRKVWVAMEDPNPRVSGQGLARLRAAGIEVAENLLARDAERLNRGFLSRMRRQRPFVCLKLAASLDARTAMASGESQWITSAEARRDVHRLRAEAGAVLTGSGTVLSDDPALTVREFAPPLLRQPDRIVLDTRGRVPLQARVWQSGARRLWFTANPGPAPQGVERRVARCSALGQLDLQDALAQLGAAEVNEVLLECGPTLAGAFLQQNLVDEIVAYVAPTLLGHEGRPFAKLPGLARLEQQLRWRFTELRAIGPDARLTLHPQSD